MLAIIIIITNSSENNTAEHVKASASHRDTSHFYLRKRLTLLGL